MALAVIAYLSRSASMEIAMRYEMSEAAAAFAMLGAVVSIGVWIFGLFYSGTILDNLFSNGWLLALGGILYFVSRAITEHIEKLKREDESRRSQ
jgi:hypothetical protein